MAEEIHIGDVGTAFIATLKDEEGVVIDVTLASSMEMWLKKPDETVLDKTAVFVNSGSDGKIQYITVDGDLDLDGGWQFQAVVEVGGGRWHTDVHKFKVKPNLKADD